MVRKRRIGTNDGLLDALITRGTRQHERARSFVAFPDAPEFSELIRRALMNRVIASEAFWLRVRGNEITAIERATHGQAPTMPMTQAAVVQPVEVISGPPPLPSKHKIYFVAPVDVLKAQSFYWTSKIDKTVQDRLGVSDRLWISKREVAAQDILKAGDDIWVSKKFIDVQDNLTAQDAAEKSKVMRVAVIDTLMSPTVPPELATSVAYSSRARLRTRIQMPIGPNLIRNGDGSNTDPEDPGYPWDPDSGMATHWRNQSGMNAVYVDVKDGKTCLRHSASGIYPGAFFQSFAVESGERYMVTFKHLCWLTTSVWYAGRIFAMIGKDAYDTADDPYVDIYQTRGNSEELIDTELSFFTGAHGDQNEFVEEAPPPGAASHYVRISWAGNQVNDPGVQVYNEYSGWKLGWNTVNFEFEASSNEATLQFVDAYAVQYITDVIVRKVGGLADSGWE